MLQFPRLTAGQAGEQKSNLLQKKKKKKLTTNDVNFTKQL